MIELGLVHGIGCDTLGARYGLSKHQIWRHGRAHLSAAQRAALIAAGAGGKKPTPLELEELRRAESEGLLGHVIAQRGRLQAAIELATANNDSDSDRG